MTSRKLTMIAICVLAGLIVVTSYILLIGRKPQFRIAGISGQVDRFGQEINNAKKFAERMISHYKIYMDQEIYQSYIDSLRYSGQKNVSIYFLYSTLDEAYMYISESDQNNMLVEITEYPVQVALFYQSKGINSGSSPFLDEEALASIHMGARAFMTCSELATFVGGTIISDSPKFFSLKPQTTVILNNMELEYRLSDSQTITWEIRNIGLLFKPGDLSWVLSSADKIGEILAEIEVKKLFGSMLQYAKAMAQPSLTNVARSIEEKRERSKRDQSFKYDPWQEEADLSRMWDTARYYGIEDSEYVGKVLVHESKILRTGTLLWYYSGHIDFMMQWMIINAVLGIMALAHSAFKKIQSLITMTLALKWSWAVIVVTINGFVFYARPADMSLPYWIIPFVLMCFALLVGTICPRGREFFTNH